MYKYKYIGQGEVHLPKHNKSVERYGDIVETEQEINHPDFELVTEQEPLREKKEPENIQHDQEEQQEEITE